MGEVIYPKRPADHAGLPIKEVFNPKNAIMGRRQAVRHRILVPASGGSNPPAPAIFPGTERWDAADGCEC